MGGHGAGAGPAPRWGPHPGAARDRSRFPTPGVLPGPWAPPHTVGNIWKFSFIFLKQPKRCLRLAESLTVALLGNTEPPVDRVETA